MSVERLLSADSNRSEGGIVDMMACRCEMTARTLRPGHLDFKYICIVLGPANAMQGVAKRITARPSRRATQRVYAHAQGAQRRGAGCDALPGGLRRKGAVCGVARACKAPALLRACALHPAPLRRNAIPLHSVNRPYGMSAISRFCIPPIHIALPSYHTMPPTPAQTTGKAHNQRCARRTTSLPSPDPRHCHARSVVAPFRHAVA